MDMLNQLMSWTKFMKYMKYEMLELVKTELLWHRKGQDAPDVQRSRRWSLKKKRDLETDGCSEVFACS